MPTAQARSVILLPRSVTTPHAARNINIFVATWLGPYPLAQSSLALTYHSLDANFSQPIPMLRLTALFASNSNRISRLS